MTNPGADSAGVRHVLTDRPIWLDIENPPQVQYLTPFLAAFRAQNYATVVSARDSGITTELLRQRGVAHSVVGHEPPAGRAAKLLAVSSRAARLARLVRRVHPAAVVCSSRAAAIVARAIGIPCFVFCDYEYAELGLYRRFGSTLVHPDVIPREHFQAIGFPCQRLLSFAGLKEDISFAGVDMATVAAHDFGPRESGVTRVLVRPPAESSHYFDPRSREFVLALLRHLAGRRDVLTVFAPRHPSQIAYIEPHEWRRPPVVIERAIPFLSLLKAVDRVVSAGGTMLREAAYLGVPAYSLFAGSLGAVDDHLRRTGRLTVLESDRELGLVTAPAEPLTCYPRNPALIDQLVRSMLLRIP